MEHVVKIVNGPSLLDIDLSLLQGNPHSPKNRRTVYFTTEKGTFELAVTGLLQEDGSGKSWIVKGYVIGTSPVGSDKVSIYFHTDKRKGSVRAQ